ncbi:MAG TPA: carboxypeptidase regulatory-like domain-containing protein [Gemmatimonadaceae bacterium]
MTGGSSISIALAAVVAIAAAPRASLAQGGTATLTGRILDPSGTPVPGVRVIAQATGASALTDTTGHFAFHRLAGGTAVFLVRRMGFEPAQFSAELQPRASLNLDVTLAQAPVELPGMQTTAESRVRLVLSQFYRHRDANNGGHFFVRADVEAQKPLRLSDMLRTLAGVQIGADPVTGQTAVRMRRANDGSFHDCPVEYWVDGMRMSSFSLDDIPATDVEAMEVYEGPSTLPTEYNRYPGTAACGTVAIWTRVPIH